jgi:GT2 family glycosyltransferase
MVRNGVNYSYPKSQNIGIAVARYDWLAFLNNDIIVSPDWDASLIASMQRNDLLAATVCGIEQVENAHATKQLKRQWKRIKNLRTRQRAEAVGDIKPLSICLDVFVLHYIRLTVKSSPPRFADRANLIGLADKWTPAQLAALEKLNQ